MFKINNEYIQKYDIPSEKQRPS